ncbi:hypothetical protein CIT292_08512 [Citrobacter youngae ATCC 29220]|uniref:L-asparaginase n=1 Tax=Citrobacter youngae ATCC 29220 TaxID=500640 RepID=D4BDE5_9ENTR|nr:hypothetical protein CIT292_08512 [Citrobacter youngae ATCC 29220]
MAPIGLNKNNSPMLIAGQINTLRAYPIRAILLAILNLGSARNPHVLRVRSGFCALSVFKLPAPITPTGIGS